MTFLAIADAETCPGVVSGGLAERIVDAALRCVARWGMAKTTLDDVAREAGCGRATVYRLFPGGRDGLWDAVIAAEGQRFFTRLAARAAAAEGLEGIMVALVTEAADALTSHAALQFLLRHEPEAILPHLAFHRGDAMLGTVAVRTAALVAPWLEGTDPEAAPRATEWVARLVISYLTSPDAHVDLLDDASARRLVRLFVLPGLRPAAAPS